MTITTGTKRRQVKDHVWVRDGKWAGEWVIEKINPSTYTMTEAGAPANARRLKAHHSLVFDSPAPATVLHTCHEGPMCREIWEGSSCPHGSCLEMLHETCVGCFSDAVAEEAEASAEDLMIQSALNAHTCPPPCGLPVTFQGIYGAPGSGQVWGCSAGHPWSFLSGSWADPARAAHILSPADVA